MNVEFAPGSELALKYDELKEGDGHLDRQGSASVSWQLDEYWKVAFGLTYSEIMAPRAIAAGKSGYDGSRLDAGARLEYRPDDDRLYYVFAQGTLSRSGDIRRNDRAGVGAELRLSEKLGLAGEVSYGTGGLGGLAAITYDPTADDHYYLGYRLDPGRAFDLDRGHDLVGTDRGAIVLGARRRIDDTVSAYAENNYDLFGRRRSLAQTYGVVYTPDALWTLDAGFEAGIIRDDTTDPATGLQRADFRRYSGSLALGYNNEEEGINARIRGEGRFESSDDGSRDRNTYLFAAGLGWKTSEDWRLLANVDAVVSRADAGAFHDGDYVEASIGYAYRPVDNNRLNALFKYTFLHDLPGNDQVSAITGTEFGPLQRSHILSVDANYKLFPWLTVGGKYGFRYGQVRYRDASVEGFADGWQRSSAHLGILRTDLHIVKNWDAMLEGRVLHMPEAGTTDFGALVAVYRHISDNFKVGVGYNFGRFSDDLRDLTLNDRGVFLNVIGKF